MNGMRCLADFVSRFMRLFRGALRCDHDAFERMCRYACALIALGACGQTLAQDFPTKPIRIIVPFTTGGPVDLIARVVATPLALRLGQPAIVENKPGGGAVIGTDFVAKAPPDGYTILMTGTLVPLSSKLPYDFERDLAPISMLGRAPFVLVVHPGVKANTVGELIALAKAQPGKLSFGSAGVGITSHLTGELFSQKAGINVVHIPYKGQAPATTDLLGGQFPFMFSNLVASLTYLTSGKLRALAVTGKTRLALLPDVPTIAESGLPDFDASIWFGALTTTGTPIAVIDRLSREMASIAKRPEVRDKLTGQGIEPFGSTAGEFASVIKRDQANWADVIKKANIRIEQ